MRQILLLQAFITILQPSAGDYAQCCGPVVITPGDSVLSVSWSAPSSSSGFIEKYVVYSARVDIPGGAWDSGTDVSGGTALQPPTQLVLSGLLNNARYAVIVRAVPFVGNILQSAPGHSVTFNQLTSGKLCLPNDANVHSGTAPHIYFKSEIVTTLLQVGVATQLKLRLLYFDTDGSDWKSLNAASMVQYHSKHLHLTVISSDIAETIHVHPSDFGTAGLPDADGVVEATITLPRRGCVASED